MIGYWIGRAEAAIELGLPFGADKVCPNGVCPDFNAYFTGIVNFSIVVAGLVAVLVIVYAGFMYTQSQGEAAKVSQAKELIAGALTGLALLLLIRLILPTLNIGRILTQPTTAYAQLNTNSVDLGNTALPNLTWDKLFDNVIGLLVGVVGLAAMAGVIYSGYMIITAGGDPGQAAKGRSNLLWSVLGLIVAITAYTIVSFAFKLGGSL